METESSFDFFSDQLSDITSYIDAFIQSYTGYILQPFFTCWAGKYNRKIAIYKQIKQYNEHICKMIEKKLFLKYKVGNTQDLGINICNAQPNKSSKKN